jgi:hypothetical protein
LRQSKNWLSRLHHLTDFEIPRADQTCGAGAEFGVPERVFRRAQLRHCRFKRTFRASQCLLRLIECDLGGETLSE